MYLSNDWSLVVISAILSNTSILETEPLCPTGNCTFPVFSSLGFCSNCIDITEFLQENSYCWTESRPIYERKIIERNCTYQLPLSGSNLKYYTADPETYQVWNGSIGLSWTYGTLEGPSGPLDSFEGPSFLTRSLNSYDWDWDKQQYLGQLVTPFKLPGGDVIPNSLVTIALIKPAPWTGSIMTLGIINTASLCALSIMSR